MKLGHLLRMTLYWNHVDSVNQCYKKQMYNFISNRVKYLIA